MTPTKIVTAPPGEELLTVAMVAKESGFKKRTIWRHIEKGALPIVRVGPFKRPRIRRRDFDSYVSSQ